MAKGPNCRRNVPGNQEAFVGVCGLLKLLAHPGKLIEWIIERSGRLEIGGVDDGVETENGEMLIDGHGIEPSGA